MDTIDPYMMTSYYPMPSYYPMDLARSMQMPNIMEVDHMGWERCEKLSDTECDNCLDASKEESGPTELNPDAPDFNPGSIELTNQKNWMFDPAHETDYECVINVGNEQLKMSAVSMDLVMAANYILNDVFSFITPEVPMLEMPEYEINQNVTPTKKPNAAKSNKYSGAYHAGMLLVKPDISYEKAELMAIAQSPLCQVTPQAWPMIAKRLPRLVRREGPTANIIIKEVRAIKKQEEEQTNTDKGKTNE